MPHVLAYLDAGSGSLLIQAAVATIVAVPIVLRSKVAGVVRAVRRTPRQEQEVQPGPDQSPR